LFILLSINLSNGDIEEMRSPMIPALGPASSSLAWNPTSTSPATTISACSSPPS